jgi:hypothetical protein
MQAFFAKHARLKVEDAERTYRRCQVIPLARREHSEDDEG